MDGYIPLEVIGRRNKCLNSQLVSDIRLPWRTEALHGNVKVQHHCPRPNASHSQLYNCGIFHSKIWYKIFTFILFPIQPQASFAFCIFFPTIKVYAGLPWVLKKRESLCIWKNYFLGKIAYYSQRPATLHAILACLIYVNYEHLCVHELKLSSIKSMQTFMQKFIKIRLF